MSKGRTKRRRTERQGRRKDEERKRSRDEGQMEIWNGKKGGRGNRQRCMEDKGRHSI